MEEKVDSKSFRIFVVMLMVVFFLWFGNYVFFLKWENEDRGTFGDMFGFVNALFSGLAFAGLIYTAMMQKEELKLQRDELGLTRQELNRMVQTQELSERALKQQAQAYTYSAIVNGHNSFVVQLNKELEELKDRHRTLTFLNSIGDEIEQKEIQLKEHLKLIQKYLNLLESLNG